VNGSAERYSLHFYLNINIFLFFCQYLFNNYHT
jgi:hypothetical protein